MFIKSHRHMPSTYHRQHQSLYIEYFYCNYYKAHRYHLKRRNIQAIRFLQTSTHSPFYSVFVGFVKISEYFSRHPSFHFRQFTSFYLAKQGVQMKIFSLLNIPMFCWLLRILKNIFRLFTIPFPH